jgi:hypothetical protein
MRCPQSIEGEPNENPMFIALLVERDSRMVWQAARRVRPYFLPLWSFSACKESSLRTDMSEFTVGPQN